MLFDLNVPWPSNNYNAPTPQQLKTLKNTIAILEDTGYSHIALNFSIAEGLKIPNDKANPINLALFDEFKGRIVIYTRLTLTISDPSQLQGLSKLQNSFDLVAISPKTEKALQVACSNLDIDIISLPLSERLPFYLKHKLVGAGIDKGIKFEVSYCNCILGAVDAVSRRNFFSNVTQLIRASRSRGLVISSGSSKPLFVRSSFDVLNLLTLLGLDHSRGKSFMTDVPNKVIMNGRLRIVSYKQTVFIGNDVKDLASENSSKKNDPTGYKRKLDQKDEISKKIKI